jgi:hypothetical protein
MASITHRGAAFTWLRGIALCLSVGVAGGCAGVDADESGDTGADEARTAPPYIGAWTLGDEANVAVGAVRSVAFWNQASPSGSVEQRFILIRAAANHRATYETGTFSQTSPTFPVLTLHRLSDGMSLSLR